jgi:hypothetical protein
MFVQESPANAVDPPFTNHGQRQHSFPRPSHPRSRTAPLHLNSSEQPLQPSVNAVWEPSVQIPSIGSQQYPAHTSNALVPGHLTSDHTHQTNSGSASWPVVGMGEVAVTPSTFHRVQDEDQPWGVVQSQPEHGPYIHAAQPQLSSASSAIMQGSRRPSVRRKVAKVPSSFVERQEKLKVSKRKGPLPERQREKTHTMRKTKRICVRCRFYKSGVSSSENCTDLKLINPV